MKINLSVNQYEEEFGKSQQMQPQQLFRPFWDSSARCSEQKKKMNSQYDSQLFTLTRLKFKTDSSKHLFTDKLDHGLTKQSS